MMNIGNLIFQADQCPLTGLKKTELKIFEQGISQDFGKKGHQWFYPYKEHFLLIVEDELFNEKSFWDDNKTGIYYLIENGVWPNGKMVDKSFLEVLITSSEIPKTPLDKMNEVLLFISSNQKHFGELYHLDKKNYNSIIRKIGVLNPDELEGLLRETGKYGLLEIKSDHSDGMVVILTLEGWKVAQGRNENRQSKTVFVAMAFNDEMFDTYAKWIVPAIEESGFRSYIVSEQHPDSDKTINDSILAGIKKAKFTIADFSHRKAGVYFEAGYALGRGQKVIYTCQEDHIGTAHFDTRNYQHLVWKDGADLKKKLMDKIEVFIKA